MAVSLNKAMLIGNVGREPEIRLTQDGKELATFPLATTETWRDKSSGDRKEKTEWHRVVIFVPALISIIKKYVHKGTKIYVEGSLQTREWNDQSGVKKFTTEIILQSFTSTLMILSGKKDKDIESIENSNLDEHGSNKSHEAESIDDEIPF